MTKIFLLAGVLALLLAGCGSPGPVTESNTAPGVKFKNFESYNFIQPLGTDTSSKRSSLSSMLMNSMMREMAERGLRRTDESPDLLVDFIVTADDPLAGNKTQQTDKVNRSHWDSSFSTWPSYQETLGQYPQGTLIIDLIDTSGNALVAEGVAEGQIRGSKFTQPQLDEIVRGIVKDIW